MTFGSFLVGFYIGVALGLGYVRLRLRLIDSSDG